MFVGAKLKASPLRPGDTVGIVAPASFFPRDQFDLGCEQLRRMGYLPFWLPSIFDRDLYFAGSAVRRARELEEMFQREEVRAILCARGGYGSNYLLPEIDLDIIRRYPKIFIGYSDITTLLTYFYDAAGLVGFQGPMVVTDLSSPDSLDTCSWNAALSGRERWTAQSDNQPSVLKEGHAEGVLYGGCLSMLVASLGTPYEIQTAGTILFLEDLATKPYQIDRMLKQLEAAGKLREVNGIIFGEMIDCFQPGGQIYDLTEVILRALAGVHVPMIFGFSSGHVRNKNVTLPVGVRVRLIAEGSPQLEILESATSAETAAGAGE